MLNTSSRSNLAVPGVAVPGVACSNSAVPGVAFDSHAWTADIQWPTETYCDNVNLLTLKLDEGKRRLEWWMWSTALKKCSSFVTRYLALKMVSKQISKTSPYLLLSGGVECCSHAPRGLLSYEEVNTIPKHECLYILRSSAKKKVKMKHSKFQGSV